MLLLQSRRTRAGLQASPWCFLFLHLDATFLRDLILLFLHSLGVHFEQLGGLAAVRGVIIQKSRPGRRRATKRYVP